MQQDEQTPRFPHDGSFRLHGQTYTTNEVLAALTRFVSDERQANIADVVAKRTYSVLPVVEGAINTGNVNAVMRTAEALGYGALHLIEGDPVKHSKRTTAGADKWLDVTRWPDPTACAQALKARGYRLVVTHLDGGQPLDAFDFTQPTALVFGNEAEGVSDALLAHADARCIIPMEGFVESFNLSVAAALSLYHARYDRIARQGHHGDLTPKERRTLTAAYYLRSVREAARVLAHLKG